MHKYTPPEGPVPGLGQCFSGWGEGLGNYVYLKQSQKRYMVSGSLCLSSFIKVELQGHSSDMHDYKSNYLRLQSPPSWLQGSPSLI